MYLLWLILLTMFSYKVVLVFNTERQLKKAIIITYSLFCFFVLVLAISTK